MLQHELEMKKLEVQMKLGLDFNSEKSGEKFDVAKYIKFISTSISGTRY